MRPTGHRWRRLRDRFRADCRNRRAPCWICRQPIDYQAPPQTPTAFEADHYKPVTTHQWLAYDYTNLRPAHVKCNRARQAKPDQHTGWIAPNW
jgi:5-methylcytosine-specific restriction endonuclease McrA